MPLAAGTTLGPYAVVTFVGAGGMGEIYRARDTRLDRTVALKILRKVKTPTGASDSSAKRAPSHNSSKTLFPVPLNSFEAEISMDYAVTPDGQKFVVLTDARSKSPEPLTAVLNWTSMLKK
jgi:serine/threonine protein kinase